MHKGAKGMVHPVRLNLSLILTNERKFEEAIKQSTRVIFKEEENVRVYAKAYFRRAQTYFAWERFEEARENIERALQYSNDKALFKLLDKIKIGLKEAQKV